MTCWLTDVAGRRGSEQLRHVVRHPFWLTIISWGLVVAWAAFIFFMSSNTNTGLNEGLGLFSRLYQGMKDLQLHLLGPDVDALSSVAHFCEYAVLGMLLMQALRLHMPTRRAFLVAVVCASLYGATDEVHQLFVSGRMSDPVDWMIDTMGAAAGAGVAYALIRKRSRRARLG